MNNRQVAHLWAQQTRETGRGSNFYFNGPTIYSYGGHFPIATFRPERDAQGRQVVLFTVDGYSKSTSRHISYTWQALHGLPVRVFRVRRLGTLGAHCHSINVLDYLSRYTALLEQAARARIRGASLLAEAADLKREAADYAAVFDVSPVPAFPEPTPEGMAEIRERARLAAEANREQREARERQLEQQRAEMETKWRAGESNGYAFWGAATLLRLSADGQRVETSRGAHVPADCARVLWPLVLRAIRNGTRYTFGGLAPDAPSILVGDFALREIRADGTTIIGCHTLTFAEMARLAPALGLEVPTTETEAA